MSTVPSYNRALGPGVCVLTDGVEGLLPALGEAVQVVFDGVGGAELEDNLFSVQLQAFHPIMVSLHGSQLDL